MLAFHTTLLIKIEKNFKSLDFLKYTELVGDVEADVSLDSSDHEMVKPEILKEASKTNAEIAALDFRRRRFWLVQRSAWQHHTGDCFNG